MNHLFAYWRVLGESRNELLSMVALFLVVSVMDVIGISMIGPYVAAVLEPQRLERYPGAFAALQRFGAWFGLQPLVALGLSLIILFVVKALFAYRIHRHILRFAFEFRALLIERLMGAYLAMPFAFFLERSSASLVQSVTNNTKVLTDDMLIPSLRFAADLMVLSFIAAFLLWVDPFATLVLGGCLAATFFVFIRAVRPRVRAAGKAVAEAHEGIISGVTQGIQGIKEIKVLGAEPAFLSNVRHAAKQNTVAQTTFNATLVMPRYLMETVVVVFILGLTLFALGGGRTPAELFGLLAMFAAAGLRALPAMSQMSSSLTSMNYSVYALHAVDEDLRSVRELGSLEAKDNPDRQVAFGFERLAARGLSYMYAGSNVAAVDGIDLEIQRGTTVGLVGESGSGKTTLVDLLVGLHPPTSGCLSIDGRALTELEVKRWMSRIAYIPQTPFVADATVAQNIAFGSGARSIDPARLARCITDAHLDEVVRGLPDGVDTKLGGFGSRLSGGERQRIALARALYQDRDVLVFDEATSALDHDTEREVIATIDALRGRKTMIVIAHRMSTVRGCDVVHKMSRGRIVASGTPLQMLPAEGNAGISKEVARP
jgi:ABC-type multidrug transport system fused ATPase/permease subunit